MTDTLGASVDRFDRLLFDIVELADPSKPLADELPLRPSASEALPPRGVNRYLGAVSMAYQNAADAAAKLTSQGRTVAAEAMLSLAAAQAGVLIDHAAQAGVQSKKLANMVAKMSSPQPASAPEPI